MGEIAELRDVAAEVRDASPEEASHAGELETSLYSHIAPEPVDLDEAVRDVSSPDSPHFNRSALAGKVPNDAPRRPVTQGPAPISG